MFIIISRLLCDSLGQAGFFFFSFSLRVAFVYRAGCFAMMVDGLA